MKLCKQQAGRVFAQSRLVALGLDFKAAKVTMLWFNFILVQIFSKQFIFFQTSLFFKTSVYFSNQFVCFSNQFFFFKPVYLSHISLKPIIGDT